MPFSPVQSARKLSAVLGTTSLYCGAGVSGAAAAGHGAVRGRGRPYELEGDFLGLAAADGDVHEDSGALWTPSAAATGASCCETAELTGCC